MSVVQPVHLKPDEVNRAQRYRQPEDRNRFTYARNLMRLLLSQYCRQAPDMITFTTGLNGKPQLSHTDTWHINVSHAGNWILIGVGRSSVGVDVEVINPSFAFQDLLSNSFSAPEQQHILGDAQPGLTFYQLWTRKEALVKATAKGIDDDFSQIPSLTGMHPRSSHLVGTTGNWIVQSIPVADECVAALAYPKTSVTPKFYTVDSGFFTYFTS